MELPQLPNTIEVLPEAGSGSRSASHHMAPSRWVWLSMIPGITIGPAGVDLLLAVDHQAGPDLGDQAVAHPHVGGDAGRTGAVDDGAAADDHVPHGSPSFGTDQP